MRSRICATYQLRIDVEECVRAGRALRRPAVVAATLGGEAGGTTAGGEAGAPLPWG